MKNTKFRVLLALLAAAVVLLVLVLPKDRKLPDTEEILATETADPTIGTTAIAKPLDAQPIQPSTASADEKLQELGVDEIDGYDSPETPGTGNQTTDQKTETQPKPTEPKPTEPKPTEPKPTEPKPTEPKPTEPKPTEPKPTEPKPTEPRPTQPNDTPIIPEEDASANMGEIDWD